MGEEERTSATALLIIDMINDLAFEGGAALAETVAAILAPLETLVEAARAADVPIVYVNDNFDQWHSDRERIVEHCLRDDSRGRAMVARLRPRSEDYFVIKPQFSGFYATNLPVLLPRLNVSRLILTGIAADICVLFTAADAHMRHYDLWVPRDVVASEEAPHRDWALGVMEKTMGADTRPSSAETLAAWLRR
ncbi:cysteine hydrolase family protein [Sphingomonas morindae]|uniref:Cysteine hydrolase n=1 Tax=Sphingomonas morindae TaxID=1541170 RepID=A0ABY4X5I0_9SPHN|nr:isochorismatase family cysteine hydrolase [Sphingomonas morindae]USI72090.1 cysteine hydrolase [Sphingomonas morindae]